MSWVGGGGNVTRFVTCFFFTLPLHPTTVFSEIHFETDSITVSSVLQCAFFFGTEKERYFFRFNYKHIRILLCPRMMAHFAISCTSHTRTRSPNDFRHAVILNSFFFGAFTLHVK